MGGDGSSSEDMEMRRRFPLVMCKDCKFRRVRHYVSKTPENYLRHFYKCTNHAPYRKDGCDMWKWEDEYEEYLQKNCPVVEDQSVGSSSMQRTSEVKEKRGRGRKMKNEQVLVGSGEIESHLKEIIWLLKAVILALGFLVFLVLFLLFVYVLKN